MARNSVLENKLDTSGSGWDWTPYMGSRVDVAVDLVQLEERVAAVEGRLSRLGDKVNFFAIDDNTRLDALEEFVDDMRAELSACAADEIKPVPPLVQSMDEQVRLTMFWKERAVDFEQQLAEIAQALKGGNCGRN